MCQTNVYAVHGQGLELVLEDVTSVVVEGTEVLISNLFGEQVRLCARIKEVNLIDQRVLVEKLT